jgi:SET and MYND domain-containing protein
VIYTPEDMQRLFNHPDLVSDPEYMQLWQIVNQSAAGGGEAKRAMDAVVGKQQLVVYKSCTKVQQEKWMALYDSVRVNHKTPGGIWRSNAYSEPIEGLYETRCRMNHSCDPNTVAHGLNDAIIRATRTIMPGEEITCSYLEEDLPLQERQTELRWKYGFDCRCSKCQSEARNLLSEVDKLETAGQQGL